MKLTTSIPPRRDGTVIHRVDNQRLVFGPDDDGRLVCEVADELAARVLASPLFEAVQAAEAPPPPAPENEKGDEPEAPPPPPAPQTPASKQAVVKKGKKD